MTDPNIEKMRKLAEQSSERPTIYPTLEFTPNGDKYAEGAAVVRFRETMPRVVTNPHAKGDMPKDFYSILVDLVEPSDFGQVPGVYQLNTSAAGTSLTGGILEQWRNNNENLENVKVRIEAYCYDHKKHGKTRSYRVLKA